MKGVPLRIELGPRDVAKSEAVLARRDVPGKAGKLSVPLASLRSVVDKLLEEIQSSLLSKAREFASQRTREAASYDEIKEAVEQGFALSFWCGDPEDEVKLKEDTKATTRCIPLDQEESQGVCGICGKRATKKAIFGRAY
jgi:prolyl-tRNA synthetase